ncbi:hypothetical protein EVA_17894 [gut metagenome]|uniref:Uncharacterized protein n=1 Tax=gut metagenome TaxID=749906 RepID=J9G369_9ZZZZ
MEKTKSNSLKSTAIKRSSLMTETSFPPRNIRLATAEKIAPSRSTELGLKRGDRPIPRTFM